MDELRILLTEIDDSYSDFINAIIHYSEKKQTRIQAVSNFIRSNPQVSSSDVVRFVSEQEDFYEDAAYMNVV